MAGSCPGLSSLSPFASLTIGAHTLLPRVEHFLPFQGLRVGKGFAGPRGPAAAALSCSHSAIFRRGAALQGDATGVSRPHEGEKTSSVSRTEPRCGAKDSLGRGKPCLFGICPGLSRFWMWKRRVRNGKRIQAAERQAITLFSGERLNVYVRLNTRVLTSTWRNERLVWTKPLLKRGRPPGWDLEEDHRFT